MSSITMFQFLWPGFQLWVPLGTFLDRAQPWLRLQRRSRSRSRSVQTNTPSNPFFHTLSVLIEITFEAAGVSQERVEVNLKVMVMPPLERQPLLLHLVGELVDDALRYSFHEPSAGHMLISLDQVGDTFELLVEDNGWRERSQASWLTANQIVQVLTEAAGGSLRRNVDWACNRAIVSLPR